MGSDRVLRILEIQMALHPRISLAVGAFMALVIFLCLSSLLTGKGDRGASWRSGGVESGPRHTWYGSPGDGASGSSHTSGGCGDS
jgi:hypothetical protein